MDTYDGDHTYTYDEMENIETVKVNTEPETVYSYDMLGRLTQEDNRWEKYRQVWEYDNGGNITSKKVYPLTYDEELGEEYSEGKIQAEYVYTYDSKWKDMLISRKKITYEYDSAGTQMTFDETETFTYDELGNPTIYKGNALTWTDVRRLASYGIDHKFAYGADGIRYKKNDIIYTLDGSRILKETGNGRTITYYYGESGVIGFNYNGTDYFYIKNLQGDVIAICNANGKYEAEYTYDAWGNCKVYSDRQRRQENTLASFIGNINPFRYRSYYYDVETGLYYLQTRYYDPEVGRFINSDSLGYLGDGIEFSNYNMFAYCGDNPVMMIDPYGTAWYDFFLNITRFCFGISKNYLADEVYLGSKKTFDAVTEVAENIVEDYINYNTSNTSEQAVIDAHYFSSYKGKLVIKLPIGTNAFSFGIMFIGDDVGSRSDPIETIQHEYGHTVQYDQMGFNDYLFDVAIPSVTANILQRQGKLPYDYYGSPWESEADRLGGVSRTSGNTPWPSGAYNSIWDLFKLF